jgi:hypothetical protein
MPVRIAVGLALAALVGGASADEPYTPPGMSLGPPASADPSAVASTAAASPASTAPRGEWGVGAVVGRRSGWSPPDRLGEVGLALEADLLAHLGERFVLGAMISSGLAVEALAGVRFRLSDAHRLDLLAGAGFTRQELSSTETYLAPTVDGRAGFSWARREGGGYSTVGVAVRHAVPDRTEPLLCGTATCGTVQVGGGTLVGAFVTVGRASGLD